MPQHNHDLDAVDRRILQELRSNGRISNVELAERVGLSASACLRRVQELERRDIITGYRATLNPHAIDAGFLAYVAVGLSDHSQAAQSKFETAMSTAPQVTECHNITGTVEYLLRVEVSDIAAYKAFHTDVLGTLSQVTSITSYIVLSSPKDERS